MKRLRVYADTSVFGGCFDEEFAEESKRLFEEIATASIANVDFVVSWNFKHIVHYEKIHGYHAVNLVHGYRAIEIYSPLEVVNL